MSGVQAPEIKYHETLEPLLQVVFTPGFNYEDIRLLDLMRIIKKL